jgi:hypothetical protein
MFRFKDTAKLLLLPIFLAGAPASADEPAATKDWEQAYQQCTTGCSKDFYFSEHSAAPFAGVRSACITGCGSISSETLPGYQRCYSQCKKTFPYRHGQPDAFAEFQQACVLGCGNIGRQSD